MVIYILNKIISLFKFLSNSKQIIILIILLFSATTSSAENFTAVQPGDWNQNVTWGTASGVFPGASDNATIGNAYTVTLTGNHSINNISIVDGATLNAGGQTLNVGGNWTISGGIFSAGASTVVLSGTAALTPDGNAFNDLIINDGLLGYWPLDEAGGTSVLDVSGYHLDGDKVGGPLPQASVPQVSFEDTRSLQLNGVDQYIQIDTAPALANASFTLAAYAKRSSTGADAYIFSQGTDAANNGLFFGFRSSNVFSCGFTSNDLNTSAFYTDTDWHSWICTYDAVTGSRAIYQDGVLVVSDTASADYQGTGAGRMGASAWADTDHFEGQLDEMRIYGRALTAAEANRLGRGHAVQTSVKTVTLGGELDVNGDLVINAGTLNTNGKDIDLAGSWLNRGGVLLATTPSTVTFHGSGGDYKILSGAQIFYNLVIDSSGFTGTLLDDAAVNALAGTLSVLNGTLTQTSALEAVTVTGRMLLSGGAYAGTAKALMIIGELEIEGGTFTAPLTSLVVKEGGVTLTPPGGFVHSSGTVVFSSTSAENIDPTGVLFNDLVLNTGLAACWRFEETGTASCFGGGDACNVMTTNHGVISGSFTSSTDRPSKVDFTDDHSFNFNGSNSFSVESHGAIEMSDAMTVAFWIKAKASDQVASSARIISKNQDDELSGWEIRQEAGTQRLQLSMDNGTTSGRDQSLTINTPVLDGQWHHVVCIFGRGFWKGYVDGALSSTTGTFIHGGGFGNTDLPLIIGAGSSTSFVGKLDNLRLYNRAISVGEMQVLFEGNERSDSGQVYTLDNDLEVAGSLFIGGGGLDAGGKDIDVHGDWDNTGGFFTPSTGTVTMSATSGEHMIRSNASTFKNLTLGAGTPLFRLDDALNVRGDLLLTAGAFLDVDPTNNNSISAGGNVTLDGTIYTREGTVIFNGNTALLSHGQPFYGIAIVANGRLVTNDDLNIDGILTTDASATTLDITDDAVYVAGRWDILKLGSLVATDSTIYFNGTAVQSVISGGVARAYNNIVVTNASAEPVTFSDGWSAANFTANTADTVLHFATSTQYVISDTLDISGPGLGDEITLDIVDGTGKFSFSVPADQRLNYVDVSNSAASDNDIWATHAINGGGNDDHEGAAHWIFSSTEHVYVWTGAHDHATWTNAGNWLRDDAVVDYPRTVDDKALFNTGMDPVILPVAAGTLNIGEMEMTATFAGAVNVEANLNIGGDLRVAGGLFAVTSGLVDLAVDGAVTISAAFQAPSRNFFLHSNMTQTAGTFMHNDGTVVFRGATRLSVLPTMMFNDVQLGTDSVGGSLTLVSNMDVNGTFIVKNGDDTSFSILGKTVTFAKDVDLSALDVFTTYSTSQTSTVRFDSTGVDPSAIILTSNPSLPFSNIELGLASLPMPVPPEGVRAELDLNSSLTVNGNFQVLGLRPTSLIIAAGETVSVQGDWDIRALDAFEAGINSTLELKGDGFQTIYAPEGGAWVGSISYPRINVTNSEGSVYFNGAWETDLLTITAGNASVYFYPGRTYKVVALDVHGSGRGSEVSFDKYGDGERYILNVTGGDQSVTFVDVSNSDLEGSNITAVFSIDGGNNDTSGTAHWTFSSETVSRYWVASEPGVWTSTLNWSYTSGGPSHASAPGEGQKAVFDRGNAGCSFDVDVSLVELEVNGYTGTIDTSGHNLALTGADLTVGAGATLVLSGDSILSMASSGSTLTVNGGFDATTASGSLDLDGAIYVGLGGSFIAPSTKINMGGGLTVVSGASFNANNGAIAFDGGSEIQRTISLSSGTSLSNVEIGSTLAGANVSFAANSRILGDLTVYDGAPTLLSWSNNLYVQGDVDLAFVDTLSSTGVLVFEGNSTFTPGSVGIGNNIQVGPNSSGAVVMRLGSDWDMNGVVTVASESSTSLDISGRRVLVSNTWNLSSLDVLDSSGSTLLFDNTTSSNFTSGGKVLDTVNINDGLIGYWKFDEASSDTCVASGLTDSCDSSGYALHGTWMGTPLPVADTPSLFFRDPESISLDGSAYVSFPTPSSLASASAMTMCFWHYTPSVVADNSTFLASRLDSTHANRVFISGGKYGVSYTPLVTGSEVSFVSVADVPLDAWTNVCLVYASAVGMKLFVNGVLRTTGDYTASGNLVYDTTFLVGRDPAGSSNIVSKIDDLRFYNRALTSTQITRISSGDDLRAQAGKTVTLLDDLNVARDLVISSGTLNAAMADIKVGRHWINQGGLFTGSTGTVTFDASIYTDVSPGAFTNYIRTGGASFFDITVDNQNKSGVTTSMADAMDINGSFWVTASAVTTGDYDISVAGSFTVDPSATFSAGTSSFVFDGVTVFNAPDVSIQTLQLGGVTGGGSLTAVSMMDINGELSVTNNGSTALNITDQDIYFSGNVNFTNLDDLVYTGSTMVFDGATIFTSNGKPVHDIQLGSSLAGGYLKVGDNLDLNGSLMVADNAGTNTLDISSRAVNVAGDWSLEHVDAFFASDSILAFDGLLGQTVISSGKSYGTLRVDNASVQGVTFTDAFYTVNLKSETPDARLFFQANKIFTITGALTLNGGHLGDEVTLEGVGGVNDKFTFDLTGASQLVSFVDVSDSQVLTNHVNAAYSINSGNNDNNETDPAARWIFSQAPVTRYWRGLVDADWDNDANWSLTSGSSGGASHPVSGDRAVFDASFINDCVLTSNVVVTDLVLSGYTGILDAHGYNITVEGVELSVAGGDLLIPAGSALITSYPQNTLTLSGGTLDASGGTLILAGNVAIQGGTFSAPLTVMEVSGQFTRSGAGVFLPGTGEVVFSEGSSLGSDVSFYGVRINGGFTPGAYAMDVAGDLFMNGDGFFHGAGSTVTFNGTEAQTIISRGNTYNDLVVTNTTSQGVTFTDEWIAKDLSVSVGNAHLFFGAGMNYTLTGSLNITGQPNGDEVVLNSTDDDMTPTRFTLTLPSEQSIVYADVSNAQTSGANINASETINGGGNDDLEDAPHWYFAAFLRGTVYADDGINPAGAGLIVALSINGGVADTAATDASGNFRFNKFILPGAKLAFYLKNAGPPYGTTVTVAQLSDIVDMALYPGRLIIRHDHTTGHTTNDDLAHADNGDPNILYSVVSGVLTVDPSVGLLIMPGDVFRPQGDVFLSGDWIDQGGGFTADSGAVTFTGTGISEIKGDTAFHDLKCFSPGKQLTFEQGTTQTITGNLVLAGAKDNNIRLRSSAEGDLWFLSLPDSGMSVNRVDVHDARALPNGVTAFNSENNGTTNWTFADFAISFPAASSVVETTPTIIGVAGAGQTIDLYGMSGGVEQKVATTTAGANGNFRFVQADYMHILDPGPNILTPFVSIAAGDATSAVIAPTALSPPQIPTITYPAPNGRMPSAHPAIAGEAPAGAAVTLWAGSADGSSPVVPVAATTADSSGHYVFTPAEYTGDLPRSLMYLNVTAGSVNSNAVKAILADPYGYVFDPATNEPIQGVWVTVYKQSTGLPAVPGVDIDIYDPNPIETDPAGGFSFVAVPADYYVRVQGVDYGFPSVKTSFPAGRVIVAGSKGETFSVISGNILHFDIPMDKNGNVLNVQKTVNKKEVLPGDVLTYTVTIKNETGELVGDALLYDLAPPGFKFMSGRVLLDGVRLADPADNRPLVFDMGPFATGTTKVLQYQLVVGTGVQPGGYTNTAWAKLSGGRRISNVSKQEVAVVKDELFDLSTIIGKIFWDFNGDGRQTVDDDSLTGGMDLPSLDGMTVVTERGVRIRVDRDGKFSIPGMEEGRHFFRLDERTLPQGVRLTTDKAVLLDVRPGLMQKVNFGITLQGLDKMYTQQFGAVSLPVERSLSRPEPRLNVAARNNLQYAKEKTLVEPVEFRFFTNYALYIDGWRLDIFDKDTSRLIQTFSGDRKSFFDPVFWDGQDMKGEILKLKRNYGYKFTVMDGKGHEDATAWKDLIVEFDVEKSIKDKSVLKDEKAEDQAKAIARAKWVDENSRMNALTLQAIPIDGETVLVTPLARSSGLSVKAGGRGSVIIPVDRVVNELSPDDLLSGTASAPDVKVDIILPKGEYTIESKTSALIAEDPDGASGRVKVGDDYLFFVGLTDLTAGYAKNSGHLEPISGSDQFHQGFYTESRAAFTLQGKIKGKYLIDASFDTERAKKKLFEGLDPDQYYPVYGDNSSVDYTTDNTQGQLYLMLKWDKSSAQWGNYTVNFNETEFAQFSRTLYGGTVNYQSMANTMYGEPKTKVAVFSSTTRQRAAHNEFLATGGSLYYLKNKDLIEGSEKLVMEVRDKITGLVLRTRPLNPETDYTLEYEQGRVILTEPLTALADTGTLISNSALNGDPVYLAVDYQYRSLDKYAQAARGARVRQAVGDYVQVGATYVEEAQLNNDYNLQGMDITLRPDKNTTVTAETAATRAAGMSSFLSTDGGLSFDELVTGDKSRDIAYGIKGDTRLFNRIGLNAYYKWIGHDFTTSATTSQQAKEMMGVQAVMDLTDHTRLTMRQDVQNLLDDGVVQTRMQIGAQSTTTSIVQLMHDFRKMQVTAEYRQTKVRNRINDYVTETNNEGGTAAIKADYPLNDKTTVSLQHQETVSSSDKNNMGAGGQTTLGVEHKLAESLKVRAAESFGHQGTATSVGAQAKIGKDMTASTDYTLLGAGASGGSQASVGVATKVGDVSEVSVTGAVQQQQGAPADQSVTFGAKKKISETQSVVTEQAVAIGPQASRETHTYVVETAQANGGILRTNVKQESLQEQGVVKGSTGYNVEKAKDGQSFKAGVLQETSTSSVEKEQGNKLEVGGNVNENLSMTLGAGKSRVQAVSGERYDRFSLAMAAGYLEKDRKGDPALKVSGKSEYRKDAGSLTDARQVLVESSLEKKVTENLTLSAQEKFSETTGTASTSFKELGIGAAYRPLKFDRLNLLGRYTFQSNEALTAQTGLNGSTSTGDASREVAHILSSDIIYELTNKWTLTERFAYRRSEETVLPFDAAITDTWLFAQRVDYKIDDDWKVGAEYRRLTQVQAQDFRQGMLFEITRNIYDTAEIAFGYNFTQFSDDLTRLDYTSQGPYMRMTGKFYDRTPEEMESLRQEIEADRLDRLTRALMKEQAGVKDPVSLDYSRAYTYAERWREMDKKFLQLDVMAREYFVKEDVARAKPLWVSVGEEAALELQARPLLSDYRERFASWVARVDHMIAACNRIIILQEIEKHKKASEAELGNVISKAGELYEQGDFKSARKLLLQTEPSTRRPEMRSYIKTHGARERSTRIKAGKENYNWSKVQDKQEKDGEKLAQDQKEKSANDKKKNIAYLYREVVFYLRNKQYLEAANSAKRILEIDPAEQKAQEYLDVTIPQRMMKEKGIVPSNVDPADEIPTTTDPLQSADPQVKL